MNVVIGEKIVKVWCTLNQHPFIHRYNFKKFLQKSKAQNNIQNDCFCECLVSLRAASFSSMVIDTLRMWLQHCVLYNNRLQSPQMSGC